MAEFYTNLPQKEKDRLQKTIDSLRQTQYVEPFQFNANDYDATVGFFVKRGFDRQPAEETAYVILQQAKIDSVPVTQILDVLTNASPAQLSELITVVLNANRYKTSRLGVRNTRTSKDTVSRNIKS
jgi:restriction endonuclease Mrr